MKKTLIVASLAIGMMGVLTGCGNANQPQPAATNVDQCVIDGKTAPSWVCDGGAMMEGGIFAVGSAEKSPLGPSFQRTEAESAARDALARQMKIKVKNMFKQYQATTGVGDAQTADKATENVSKQVSEATLTGSKPIKFWTSPKGTMYILVGMPNKVAENSVKKAIKTSFHNNKALWQKFLAKNADKELDAAVAKEFGGDAQ
jgi:hypothetical protein